MEENGGGSANGDNFPLPEITSAALYVGNLPYNARWQQLKDHFKEIGDVVYADIPRGQDNRSRGFGIVKFATIEEAKKAAEMYHGQEWLGRRLIIKNDEKPDYNRAPSNQRGRGGSANNGAPRRPQSNPNQLFVGNLPWSTTWQDLKDIAKDNGFNPVRADVAMSYDGKSRGWGTLAFETEDEAKRAQDVLNGIELNGRQLEVREDNKAGR